MRACVHARRACVLACVRASLRACVRGTRVCAYTRTHRHTGALVQGQTRGRVCMLSGSNSPFVPHSIEPDGRKPGWDGASHSCAGLHDSSPQIDSLKLASRCILVIAY